MGQLVPLTSRVDKLVDDQNIIYNKVADMYKILMKKESVA
jgi:hypothetical protein